MRLNDVCICVTSDSNQSHGGSQTYRRPNHQQSEDVTPSQQHEQRSNLSPAPDFQPPDARNGASASSTSTPADPYSQNHRHQEDSQRWTVGSQNGTDPAQPTRSTSTQTNKNTFTSLSWTKRRSNRHPPASSTMSSAFSRPNGTFSSMRATLGGPDPSSSLTVTRRSAKPSSLSRGNHTVTGERMPRDNSALKMHGPTPSGSHSDRKLTTWLMDIFRRGETKTPFQGKAPEKRGELPAESEAIDSPETVSFLVGPSLSR